MKKLLVVALIACSANCFAQDDKRSYKSFYELFKGNDKLNKREFSVPLTTTTVTPVKITQESIILLPLDNMPCLVPDVTGFNMPVLKLSWAGTAIRR